MVNDSMIAVENVTKRYKEEKGIFNFSFNVKKGEVFGLVGTNGSGKTTMIRQIMGFIKSSEGSIFVQEMDAWKKSDSIKKLVGYVPGQIDFPDVGTGKDFLKIQADFLGVTDLSYMNELIDRFKIDISAPLKRMSKGMKQKMALVTAFMSQPEIYILDEPSTGLDPLMRDTLIEIILEQKEKGKTIFMSSHIFKEMEETCDTVMFIKNGRIIEIVSREKFENKADDVYLIDFFNYKEHDRFLHDSKNTKNDHKMKIIKTCEKNQLVIQLPTQAFNQFFNKLSHYSIKSLSHSNASLEKYYKNNIQKLEEIINA